MLVRSFCRLSEERILPWYLLAECPDTTEVLYINYTITERSGTGRLDRPLPWFKNHSLYTNPCILLQKKLASTHFFLPGVFFISCSHPQQTPALRGAGYQLSCLFTARERARDSFVLCCKISHTH